MTAIIKINGKNIPVDDSYNDLTPEQQEMEKAYIAEQLAKGITFGNGGVDSGKAQKEPTTIAGLPIAVAPEAGAAIGATMGAMAGPAVGEALDKSIAQSANVIRPTPANLSPNAPQSVRNWLATQTSTPYAGGRDYEEAARKANIAGSKPIQSRGSNVPIRRGGLGIDVQPAPPTLPQKAAANILNAERMPKPGITRRVLGMGVAGAELGNLAKEYDEGNYGRAALSGLGAVGGAMSQSRIKPVRALGTGLSIAVPTVQKFFLDDEDKKEEEVQKKANGGSVTSPKLQSLSAFLDQLMQQSAAPTPAPAPMMAPQAAMPPSLPPAAPLQQIAQQPSPLSSVVPQMAKGGKVGGGLELAKKAIKRASEALGPHEGKRLYTTQSDRMRSTDGDLGGPGFSKFQLERPEYKGAAWGVGKPGTATAITNVNRREPEGRAIWAPMIGSETQHHSNQHVFDILSDEFNRQVSLGKLTPELRAKMNERLQTYPEYAGLFKPEMDVANPEMIKQFGDTFERRGALASLMGGKGIGGTKGQIIDYPGIMQEMTDPMTIGAPTHSVGTRLFTLNNEVEYRPDLHSAFPYILKGEDQGVAFVPVPKELVIPDWLNLVREFKGREPGYMDYTRGLKGDATPNQLITDKLLRAMEDAGYKKGGSV